MLTCLRVAPQTKEKDGKTHSKCPKIQRLVTPLTLQRKRHRAHIKRERIVKVLPSATCCVAGWDRLTAMCWRRLLCTASWCLPLLCWLRMVCVIGGSACGRSVAALLALAHMPRRPCLLTV